jgi:YbbR domain-containing protein
MAGGLLRNWDLKLAAIAIAFTLWFVVVGSERSRIVVAAPVEYVGLGDDAMLVSDAPQRVEVQLDVARWARARVTPDSVRVRADLGGANEGAAVVTLSGADVTAPSGATVVRITPSRLRLAVARSVEAALRIVPRLHGTPAPGFAPGRVTVTPPIIQVKGPRSTIEGRNTVETTPVDISGRRATVTQTVGLVLPEFAYATRGGSVHVTVEIRQRGRS